MKFTTFLSLLSKLKQISLAGEFAHSLLAPPYRMGQLKSLNVSNVKPKKAAVLLHFSPDLYGKVKFVLIQRHVYNGTHSGQISFPGGKPEAQDENLWTTALREAQEEVRLVSNRVKYICSLSNFYVPPSNFLITPFLGYSEKRCVFTPQPEEVDGIIEILLEDLIQKEPVMTKQRTSTSHFIDVPTYVFDRHQVWGATAMILSEFKILLNAGLSK